MFLSGENVKTKYISVFLLTLRWSDFLIVTHTNLNIILLVN